MTTALTERIAFVLQPQFSMLSLFCALEPLRVVNRFAGELFSWHFLSVDGEDVVSSSGIPVAVEGGINDTNKAECINIAKGFSTVFICASFQPEQSVTKALVTWLKQMDRMGVVLGGIETGCYALAQAGLMSEHTIALHWEAKAAFEESFPALQTSQQLYQVDEKRLTCAGGISAMDMMLHLIKTKHGEKLTDQVCTAFIHERMRHSNQIQPIQVVERYAITQPEIISVIELMESNIEEPLGASELAQYSGVQLRKLERLFKEHCHDTPTGFYLRLRLQRARQLLKQTKMPVVAVAVACGFRSPEYFSRRYHQVFGMSPREDRKLAPELSRMALNKS
jgi:AraC family carnitine catabolism transcriptional activator